jgi:hypothetical protein
VSADKDIRRIYNDVLCTVGKLFGREFAVVPNRIFNSVPLLLVGERPVIGPARKGKIVWLSNVLLNADRWTAEDLIIPIDGCDDPADALKAFFEQIRTMPTRD